ncbi:phage scaffolding protein [Niameybacter massiliensis]|uniref:phage scaffolding protein n=1 Tax=Niameybacter massiliensis TaxID=1658108 RepID=UPI0006B5B8F9|nr:phage scaffolding protein [Niameybacter massiliensis]
MKREWLKDLGLEVSIIDKIMDENGKDVNKVKGELESIKGVKADLETQLATANTTITELKASNTSNQELQTKVTEYEQTIENMKADSQKKEFELALENELIKLNVHSTKAARAELDMDKVKYENGQFTGLKEQTDTWAKEKSFLIKTGGTHTQYNPASGGDPDTKGYAAQVASQRNSGAEQNKSQNNPYANAWD